MIKIFLIIFMITNIFNVQKPSFPTIPTAVISQDFAPGKHTGTDFKVPVGSDVYAVLDGEIIKEEYKEGGYGNYLIIMHKDGNASLYAHLSEFKLPEGAKVKSGQLIALSGGDPNDDIKGDGNSSGPHLHLEIRKKGYIDNNLYNIDPIKYLMSFLNNKVKVFYVSSLTGVNVRLEPDINSTKIYSLDYGQIVEIIEEKNGWSRINSLRPEWVMSKWIK